MSALLGAPWAFAAVLAVMVAVAALFVLPRPGAWPARAPTPACPMARRSLSCVGGAR